MNELALFAGSGGGILGGLLCGFKTVCAVEIDPFCREVLLRRQLDGCLPRFPIWDDIKTFDGKPWQGKIDVVTGGFPCQDISCAGTRKGLAGSRSVLVYEMLRVVEEVRPAFVCAENSPNLRTHGLGEIVAALSGMGYVGRVGVLGARHVGAPHRRNRMWIVAHSNSVELRNVPRRIRRTNGQGAPVSADDGANESMAHAAQNGRRQSQDTSWWNVEPELDRVASGVAHHVDRIKAVGNGQVPAVARLAWEILSAF